MKDRLQKCKLRKYAEKNRFRCENSTDCTNGPRHFMSPTNGREDLVDLNPSPNTTTRASQLVKVMIFSHFIDSKISSYSPELHNSIGRMNIRSQPRVNLNRRKNMRMLQQLEHGTQSNYTNGLFQSFSFDRK